METPVQSKKGLSNKIIIAAAAVIIVLLAAIVLLLLRPSLISIEDGDVPKLGYDSGASVVLDEASLQAAVDEAMKNAKEGNVALLYENNAYSEDGETFSCYIANDKTNLYDMFLTIYADATLTDQIFLSGLVPPGSGFEELKLDKALGSGDHMVYVAVTQVDIDEKTGGQVLKNQVVHTMEFHVT